jgi:hypothetical protein
MTVKELKTFLKTLPKSFDDFDVVNGEYGKLMTDDNLHYRVDKPIVYMLVDEETKELCILHQTENEVEEIIN